MLPLPPIKQELVWRSASLIFFIDPRTGNNCFLLGASRLAMSWGDAFKDCWETKFNPKSRFSEVAELTDSRNFFIQANIKTKMLSPQTSYAAYLVFGISDKYAKLHSAVSIIRSFNNQTEFDCHDEQATIVQFQQGMGRAHGWLEIKLGHFYVGLEAGRGELQVQLLNTSRYRRSGLIVEGLEFRPCI